MDKLMKHKGALIAAGVIILGLAVLFWWGGNAPGMRGWTVGDNPRQTQGDIQDNKPAATDPDNQDQNKQDQNNQDQNNQNQDTQDQDKLPEQDNQQDNPGETKQDNQQQNPDKQDDKQPAADKQDNNQENKQDKQTEPAGGMEINPQTGKDKYNTDPVPEGKPLPVEPQDAVVGTAAYSCTISISCATVLDNLDWLAEGKEELVPAEGWILEAQTVTFYEGESVFNVLLRVCKQQGIHMEYTNTPMYNSAYIEGIHNLYEFDCGEGSGWMYRVNGWFPNYGCSRYQLADGDVIEWVFTCNYGDDVGGSNALGG